MTPEQQQRELSILRKAKEEGKSDEFIQRVISLDRERNNVTQETPQPSKQGVGGIKGFGLGLAKSAGSTAIGIPSLLQTLGQGIMATPSLMPGGKTFSQSFKEIRGSTGFDSLESETEAGGRIQSALKRRGTAENVGGFVGDVAQFFAPAGAITKAGQGTSRATQTTKLGQALPGTANLATRGAVEGAGFGAVAAAQQGELNSEVGMAAATGAAFPVAAPFVSKALKGVIQAGQNVLKSTAGVISGKGTQVINNILKDPEAAIVGLKGESAEVLNQSTKQITSNINKLRKDASKEFGEAMDEIQKTVNLSIPLKSVVDDSIELLDKFSIKVNKKGIDMKNIPFDKAEAKRIVEAFTKIKEWSDFTPKGIHNLSQALRTFRKSEQSPKLNAVIDGMTNSVMETLKKADKRIAPIMDKWKAAQDTLDAFKQEFAVKAGSGGTSDTIKTGKKVAGLTSGEKTGATELLQKTIPQADEILARESGRQLAEGVSRSAASIGDLLRSVVNIVATPKTIGLLTAKLGIAEREATKILSKLQGMDEVKRAASIDLLSEMLSDEE